MGLYFADFVKMSKLPPHIHQTHCKLTSYHLLKVVWQELCAIHPVQIPSDAKKQFPSKPTVSQTLRHCIQLQHPGGVTDTQIDIHY